MVIGTILIVALLLLWWWFGQSTGMQDNRVTAVAGLRG